DRGGRRKRGIRLGDGAWSRAAPRQLHEPEHDGWLGPPVLSDQPAPRPARRTDRARRASWAGAPRWTRGRADGTGRPAAFRDAAGRRLRGDCVDVSVSLFRPGCVHGAHANCMVYAGGRHRPDSGPRLAGARNGQMPRPWPFRGGAVSTSMPGLTRARAMTLAN